MTIMSRLKTDIPGLDEMIEEGVPRGRCILVCGGPGSGKTVFAMQFLYNGAACYKEKGLYISLSESINEIKSNMLTFGWNLSKLEKDGKLSLVDFSPVTYLTPEEMKKHIYGLRIPEFKIEALAELVKRNIDETKATRVAVDPITSISIQQPELTQQRRNIAHLFRALSQSGCTSIITSETRWSTLERDLHIEENLAQGVIVLHTILDKGKALRALQIEKMRGTKHDTELRPYDIKPRQGIVVYPKEKLFV